MPEFTITAKHKKSVYEYEQLSTKINNIPVKIIKKLCWRYGTFTIKSNTFDINEINEEDQFHLEDYDYQVDDLFDGCYVDYQIIGDITQEQHDRLMYIVEEHFEVLEDGIEYFHDDSWYIIYGGIELSD